MAFGVKTHEDKIDGFIYGLNTFVKQEMITASECDKIYGTHFSPNIKESPLYRLLKSKKDKKI
jgi:hypothetical protein